MVGSLTSAATTEPELLSSVARFTWDEERDPPDTAPAAVPRCQARRSRRAMVNLPQIVRRAEYLSSVRSKVAAMFRWRLQVYRERFSNERRGPAVRGAGGHSGQTAL